MKHHKHYPAHHYPSGQRGVTLIEVMVAISLLAILLVIGVPSFQSTLERSRLQATKDSLQIAFLRARSEAAKRNSSIRICPRRTNIERCKGPNNSDNWSDGWLIFYNGDTSTGNVSSSATADCSDETVDCLISVYENPNKTVCLNSGIARYVFSPRGTVSTTSAPSSTLDDAMELCNGRDRFWPDGTPRPDDKSTEITIGLDGRFSTQEVAGDCICGHEPN